MAETTASMTNEHPGWQTTAHGHLRALETGTGTWLARWSGDGLSLTCLSGAEQDKPHTTTADAETLPESVPAPLRRELAGLGAVQRLANPSLWDAITTAILRQVVRAPQARALYQRWCAAYGRSIQSPDAQLSLAPSPEDVLALPHARFTGIGAAFHRTALQAAAAAYLADAAKWSGLDAPGLVDALTGIERIGPWTARAAAADFTGDFSIYPHGDLAVRTWATRAAPDEAWPETDRAFEARWRSMCHEPGHLHTLTLLTLTWGSHARTPEHSPGRP